IQMLGGGAKQATQ
ncbi:hypothetical protein VCEDC022_003735B, partial [Vibrio cholerae O1 str. EDC-022]